MSGPALTTGEGFAAGTPPRAARRLPRPPYDARAHVCVRAREQRVTSTRTRLCVLARPPPVPWPARTAPLLCPFRVWAARCRLGTLRTLTCSYSAAMLRAAMLRGRCAIAAGAAAGYSGVSNGDSDGK
eukprot:gene34254-23889_t